MLKELKQKLESFQYAESAEITPEEREVLKEMFQVKDSFKVLFKYLCTIESEKGTQLAYDIDSLPADGYTAQEVADEVKFKQLLVRFNRMKMETIRNDFAREFAEEVKVGEEKQAKEKELNKKKQKDLDLQALGISEDM